MQASNPMMTGMELALSGSVVSEDRLRASTGSKTAPAIPSMRMTRRADNMAARVASRY